MEKQKITRENACRHLIEKELEMIGKTMMVTMDDLEWYSNNTMTSKQFEEFKNYSIKLIKKIYKCNTKKATDTFNWFNMTYGLKIKD